MNNGWQYVEQTQEVQLPEPAPEQKRGSWYLLTSLVLGLILGLIYTWVINPVIYSHSTPASLGENDKATYRSLIAEAYSATGDLERAEFRLALLEDENPVYALGSQAQRCMAEGNPTEAYALALLASALQSNSPIPSTNPIPTQTLPLNTPTP